DAVAAGSPAGLALAHPILGMGVTPTGKGYWLASSGGQIFAFGDAPFYGDTSGFSTNVVSFEATPTGRGYWMVAADGAVFAFGQARFMGPVTTAPLSSGHASVSFASSRTGTTTVVAAVGRPGALVSSAPLATTWTPAPTGRLTLSPAHSTVNVGVLQHV